MKNLLLSIQVLFGFLINEEISFGEKISFILIYLYDMSSNVALKRKIRIVHFFKGRKFLYYGNHNNLLLDHIYSNLSIYSHFYEKADVVLDVGASFGSFSLMVNYFNPKAKIFAFEPSKEGFEVLRKNCSNINNIELIERAVGSVNRSVNFYHDQGYPEGSHISNSSNNNRLSYKVMQVTLDSFIQEKKLKKISLLKIDTEGYELQALQGGFKALAISECVIVETDVNSIDNLIGALTCLKKNRFSFVRFGTINYHRNGNIGSINLIFIKNSKVLSTDLLDL